MSSGDHKTTRTLQVPLEQNQATLSLSMTCRLEEEDNATHQGEPAQSSQGLMLPMPGPRGLAEMGVSHSDYVELRRRWLRGLITFDDIRREHGPQAENLLRGWWGNQASTGDEVDREEPGGSTENDETGLLDLTKVGWWIMGLPQFGYGMEGPDMDYGINWGG